MTVRHVGPFWFEAQWDRAGWWATTKKNVRVEHVASIHVARRDGEPNLMTFVLGPLMIYVCDERKIPEGWFDRPSAYDESEKT